MLEHKYLCLQASDDQHIAYVRIRKTREETIKVIKLAMTEYYCTDDLELKSVTIDKNIKGFLNSASMVGDMTFINNEDPNNIHDLTVYLERGLIY